MFKYFASFLILSTGMCVGQTLVGLDMAAGPTTEPKKPIIFDLSGIDKTADPRLLSVRLRELG
jgi:putative endopeptidase